MEFERILAKHTDEVEKQLAALSPEVHEAVKQANISRIRLDELEQKLARRGGSGGLDAVSSQSWGAQFIADEGFRAFAENSSHPGRFRVEVKTITSGGTSGGALGGQAYRDDAVIKPQRKLHVRDLLPDIPISSGSVEYPKQTTRTNAAAPVGEAALKPQSDYAFQMETESAKTIAHWVLAARQIMEDAPQLMATIDGELRFGLALAEDNELLNGDATGEHLDGLIKNATAYAAPFDPTGTETMIDQLALARVI